jgi:hypothetical protein
MTDPAEVPRKPGIRDWSAKRSLLRALYDEVSDKAFVVRVLETRIKVPNEQREAVERCYGTLRRWDKSVPRGDLSQSFWKWIIQDFGLNVRAPRLWSSSIVEFIELFPPATADIALAVAQLVDDERAGLARNTRAELRSRYCRGALSDAVANVPVLREYNVGCNEALTFEGPTTGIQSGRIQPTQFYAVPESAAAWTALIDSENYRMYLDCLLSLKQLFDSKPWLHAVQDGRHRAAVMLGGGGSPEKDWAVVTSLLRAAKNLDFVLTDISFYMINASARVLLRRLAKSNFQQRVCAEYKLCDFLKLDEQFARRESWDSVVWALLGGTIGNVSEREFFRSIRGPSRIGDLLLIGIDTIDEKSEATLSHRLTAQYRSKELDDLLLAPVPGWAVEEVADEAEPVVNVTVSGDRHGNVHSDVPNTRTAVFSIPNWRGRGNEPILATSTRYAIGDFLEYARRFGWQHLGTELACADSTFRQLLLRRVE